MPQPTRTTRALVLAVMCGSACTPISDDNFETRIDGDGDGVTLDFDCDDGDASVGEPTVFFRDGDSDGYGSGTPETACSAPSGFVSDDGDCDDSSSTISPGIDEICDDFVDNNCDGTADGCGIRGTISLTADIPAVLGESFNHHMGYPTQVAYVDDDEWPDLVLGASSAAPSIGPSDTAGGGTYIVFGPFEGATNVLNLRPAVVYGPNDGDTTGWANTVGPGMLDSHPTVAVSSLQRPDGPGFVSLFSYDGFFSGRMAGGATLDIRGLSPGDAFGQALNTDCDLNNDGRADLIVTSHRVMREETGTRGAVYVFTGDLYDEMTASDADLIIYSDQAHPVIGHEVACPGDFDGDGRKDIVVTSLSDDGLAIAVVPASASSGQGLSEVAWYVSERDGGYDEPSLASVGDLDGDGLPEVLVGNRGAPDGGLARLFTGATGSLQELARFSGDATVWLGSAVGTAGDQDGDGVTDLLLGDRLHDNQRGAVYLVSGALRGDITVEHEAMARIDGAHEGSWLGISVAGSQDINLDGYPDLVLAASNDGTSASGAGAVYIVHGGGL